MRRVSLGLIAVTLLSAAPAFGQVSPTKIGYINSQVVLDNTPGAQAASDQFDRELANMRSTLQPQAAELDSLLRSLEAQAMTLTDSTLQARGEVIQQKQAALQAEATRLEGEAEQRRAQLVQPIMDRISRTIEAIRIEGNYAIIFDVSAGAIIAADASLDLTQEVLRRLQMNPTGAPGGQ